MLRIHLSNAQGADYEDIQRALKPVFGNSVDVGPEVVDKGFWYLDICKLAWQLFAQGQAKATLKTPHGRWLTLRSRKCDGTLYSEPSKRVNKPEPRDRPPASPIAVGVPPPVLYPPPPAAPLPYVWPGAGPWAPSP